MNGVQGMYVGVCVPRGMLRARAGQPQQACQAAASAEACRFHPIFRIRPTAAATAAAAQAALLTG